MNDPSDWVPEERRPLLVAYAEEIMVWNTKVNLISRTSLDELDNRHIKHCLALAWRRFPEHARVVDWGTGGGLPAVPLAIAFPTVSFVAVDSIAKKTAALRCIVRDLGLDNVEVWQGRAEAWEGTSSYFVSRATAPLRHLWKWSKRAMIAPVEGSSPPSGLQEQNDSDGRAIWEPGLICLKGGDLAKEIRQLKGKAHVSQWRLEEIAPILRLEEKHVLHVAPS
ncbi:MAG: 16S rRNA (guanine527-N7)-methyltransferase [Rhodothermales bacterium]|jgi:16S rRNA (guanine527-N7)-methyltransferase